MLKQTGATQLVMLSRRLRHLPSAKSEGLISASGHHRRYSKHIRALSWGLALWDLPLLTYWATIGSSSVLSLLPWMTRLVWTLAALSGTQRQDWPIWLRNWVSHWVWVRFWIPLFCLLASLPPTRWYQSHRAALLSCGFQSWCARAPYNCCFHCRWVLACAPELFVPHRWMVATLLQLGGIGCHPLWILRRKAHSKWAPSTFGHWRLIVASRCCPQVQSARWSAHV